MPHILSGTKVIPKAPGYADGERIRMALPTPRVIEIINHGPAPDVVEMSDHEREVMYWICGYQFSRRPDRTRTVWPWMYNIVEIHDSTNIHGTPVLTGTCIIRCENCGYKAEILYHRMFRHGSGWSCKMCQRKLRNSQHGTHRVFKGGWEVGPDGTKVWREPCTCEVCIKARYEYQTRYYGTKKPRGPHPVEWYAKKGRL